MAERALGSLTIHNSSLNVKIVRLKKCFCLFLHWKPSLFISQDTKYDFDSGIYIYILSSANATFNNISVIPWRSVLLVEETTDLPQVTDNLYHIMLYRVNMAMKGFELTTLVMIGTDCKFNYHTIMTTTAPICFMHFLEQEMTTFRVFFF